MNKIYCPVPGCDYTRAERKHVMSHMRNTHHISLPAKKGGDLTLHRQRQTYRYAEWLVRQGLPVDVKFFTDVNDKLGLTDGWEGVWFEEDDGAGVQGEGKGGGAGKRRGRKAAVEDEEGREDEEVEGEEDEVQMRRAGRRRRRSQMVVDDGEDDDEEDDANRKSQDEAHEQGGDDDDDDSAEDQQPPSPTDSVREGAEILMAAIQKAWREAAVDVS